MGVPSRLTAGKCQPGDVPKSRFVAYIGFIDKSAPSGEGSLVRQRLRRVAAELGWARAAATRAWAPRRATQQAVDVAALPVSEARRSAWLATPLCQDMMSHADLRSRVVSAAELGQTA